MNFLIALIPPFLYSIGNLLDKNLIHRYGQLAAPVIIAMSGIFGIFVVSSIGIFSTIAPVPLIAKLIMLLSGSLTSISVFLYLKALEDNSVLSVAPALQLTPVFSFFIDIFFFSDRISTIGLIGSVLVILGALLLTIRIEKSGIHDSFHFRTFLLTSLSAAFLAFSAALFKYYAAISDYWTVQFYEYIGVCLVAILFLVFSQLLRSHIKALWSSLNRNRAFISLNLSTEAIMIAGDFVLNYVTLALPLTYVFTINAAQPLFLLVLGLIMASIFPGFQNDLKKHILGQKVLFSVFVITLGSILVAAQSY